MEGLVLVSGLPAIVDKPQRQRAFHNAGGFKFAFWRAIPVDPRCVSLRRTLHQIRRALPRTRFHSILSVRSYGAPKNSSVSVPHGRGGALYILPAPVVDFGIYRIQLGLPDRGGGIDAVDYVVLPLFPWRRRAHIHDRRRIGGRLPVSLHHFAAARLRAAYGGDRSLCRAGSGNVRNPQSRLVRARRRIKPPKASAFPSDFP